MTKTSFKPIGFLTYTLAHLKVISWDCEGELYDELWDYWKYREEKSNNDE